MVGPASARDNGPLLLFLLGNYITLVHVSPDLWIKTPNTNHQFCDHYKYIITSVSISSFHFNVSCPFYSLLENYQFTGMTGACQMYHKYRIYQEYGLYWNMPRYNQDVRSSFPYCDDYKSQVLSMSGVR